MPLNKETKPTTKHRKMRRALGVGQHSMVSIGFYDLWVSLPVAKDWSQKLINLFVSETVHVPDAFLWLFWIMNAMWTFVYLFVVYFSFAPVISASIHRYVNYSDIQVLMMVTETETLTSTLPHNIFTYLDFFFFFFFTTYLYMYWYYFDSCLELRLIKSENGFELKKKSRRYYLPTPPLGQDMTQGQFLSGV